MNGAIPLQINKLHVFIIYYHLLQIELQPVNGKK